MVKTLPLEQAVSQLSLPRLDRNLFSSPQWLNVIQKTYGTKLFVKYIERDQQIESYIMYSVVHNFLEWKICICSYCDYCDGFVKDEKDWRLFFEALKIEFPRYRIAVRNLRDECARNAGVFKVLDTECFHFLDVRASIEELWKRCHDSHKAAVNQAGRKGVTVKRCEKSNLKDFYRLHLGVRKNKYRIFPQPFKFFENIWDAFMPQGNGFLLGAFSPEGKFIGGNVYLVCGNTLYYKFNTSDKDALQYRPNNVLFWEGIKLAKELGLSYIDLGSSGYEQTGLIRFKEHAGAQAMEITHLGYHPSDYKFSQKRILKALTWFFTLPWMPDVCVRWGSSVIYHYLA